MPSYHLRPFVRWSLCGLLLTAATIPASLQAKQVLPKLGGERQINVRTPGHQMLPAIAADAAGNYAIAWLGPDEHFIQHVYVRLFDASGAPRSGEIVVDDAAAPFEGLDTPRIAMVPDGHFAVLWSATNAWVRLYQADGTPLGQRIRIDDTALLSGTEADLAMADDGRFLVAWRPAGAPAVFVRAFNAVGQPLEPGRRIDTAFSTNLGSPRVAATEGGGFVITWVRVRLLDFIRHDDLLVAVQRPSLLGAPGPEFQLNTSTGRAFTTVVPVAHARGGFSVLWGSTVYPLPPNFVPPPDLQARRFDSAGLALGPETTLPFDLDPYNPPAVASDRYGNSFVVTSTYAYDKKPQGQLFDGAWKPIGERFQVVSFEEDIQIQPAVAAAGEGFVAVWSSGIDVVVLPPPIYGQDGNGFGIFAQVFAPPLCAEGSKVLCLGPDGRFELSIDWQAAVDVEGPGRAHRLTGDTGSFWFFDRENLEIVAKVLDGSSINEHFWVFSGSLSNVEWTLDVLDSLTGERRSYFNPLGEVASRADIRAFRAISGQPGSTSAGLASASPLSPVPSCTPGNLCFQLDTAYEVEVDFVDPRSGLHGKGQAVPLTTDSGAFTFFDASNLELVVKLLDGRAVNGKIWFFFGGLSDVDYTITVRNLATQEVRTYSNSRGQLQSRADTQAFGF